MDPKRRIAIGLLFSRSGPYAELGEQGRAGALAGIEAVNRRVGPAFRFVAEAADPAGNADRYAALARELIAGRGVRHIIGCTTSWSRKEVIPVLEKTGALLWYPCVYEGFEANEQVVYVGGCANQNILPLLDFALPAFGRRAFLLGSNYIWGWETCRIARDVLQRSGGSVLGERQVPLGDTDVGRLVEEIRAKKPDFVVNNLIGPSSYAFLEAYHALGQRDPDFAAARRPAVSCNLCENEVARLGPAAAGHYTIASYFRTLDRPENRAFLAGLERQAPAQVSAYFVQAYCSVLLIAAGIAAAGGEAPLEVLQAVKAQDTPSPLGPLRIDASTNHLHLAVHIGRALPQGAYEVVRSSAGPLAPDPFLTRSSLTVGGLSAALRSDQRPNLRIVP